MLKSIKKILRPVSWYNLRSTKPLSSVFGLDRGKPIDRYYIEQFLHQQRHTIAGKILEVAEDTYSRRFATNPASFDVLHVDGKNPKATVIGDLTKRELLPVDTFDCFICTQTFNFIYNVSDAIRGAHQVLKRGGTLLVTLAGISQISRYDMDRWGDYWRFTTKSALRCFADVFGETNVTVHHYGNVLSAVAFLEGLACDELTPEELDHVDQDYQVVITIVATKSL